MRVVTPDAAAFEERTRPLLLADEARHNLILGVPTSNSIYVKIGYRRACDSLELDFTPPAG